MRSEIEHQALCDLFVLDSSELILDGRKAIVKRVVFSDAKRQSRFCPVLVGHFKWTIPP